MDARRWLGERGEELACRHLAACGYKVVDRNFRTRFGELDIVARDGRFLVFCEVKTRLPGRHSGGSPLVAVGAAKRRQVRAMARRWLAERAPGGARPPEIRFDAIGVSLDGRGRLSSLEHVEDAF